MMIPALCIHLQNGIAYNFLRKVYFSLEDLRPRHVSAGKTVRLLEHNFASCM